MKVIKDLPLGGGLVGIPVYFFYFKSFFSRNVAF